MMAPPHVNDRKGVPPPILITGCPRSGTSLTAGIIDLCGAWGGECVPGNRDNPRGFFENWPIKRDLVKPYLRSIGADDRGQKPLPPRKLEPVPWWREAVVDSIVDQGYNINVGSVWYVKEAKACLMWQVWHHAFPDATWVIVRRRAETIARSCLATGFMRAYSDFAGWMRYVKEHEARFEIMKAAGLKYIEVWPERAVRGDLLEFESLITRLGLQWDAAAVKEFIMPEVWHN